MNDIKPSAVSQDISIDTYNISQIFHDSVFSFFIYVLGFIFGGRKEKKWGEKVINYVMRQANEIYYGSQAQNLSFISNINIKISEEICLFYFISFFSLSVSLAINYFSLFLLFIIVIILIYAAAFFTEAGTFFNASLQSGSEETMRLKKTCERAKKIKSVLATV